MFDISMTEWVGYLASLVLMISFLMKNINTHRIGGSESSDNLEEFIYDGKKQNFTNFSCVSIVKTRGHISHFSYVLIVKMHKFSLSIPV